MMALPPAILDSDLKGQPRPLIGSGLRRCPAMDRAGLAEIRDGLGSKELELGHTDL